MNWKEFSNIERHVFAIGCYYLLVGTMGLGLAIAVMVIVPKNQSWVFLPLILPLITFCYATGVLVIQHHPRGRQLGLILSVINLLNFPVGTVFGIYSLIILLEKGGKALFQK